ncbi:MAG: TIGR03936 family radical SAM-associated protein [Actinomycetota bacterium]|nr:TIGR03936 family radical SAM-associated protein [Actinomycetota bacterium]
MEKTQIRFKFKKIEDYRYLSHLDMVRFIIRGLGRAGMDLEYSQGFNPKPKISFSHPTPLGVESWAEYGDVNLAMPLAAGEFKSRLNAKLNSQLMVTEAKPIAHKVKSLMADIGIVQYRFSLQGLKDLASTGDSLKQDIMGAEDIKSSLYRLKIEQGEDNFYLLNLYGYVKIFKKKNNAIFKYNYFYDYFIGIAEKYNVNIHSIVKQEMYIEQEGALLLPMDII